MSFPPQQSLTFISEGPLLLFISSMVRLLLDPVTRNQSWLPYIGQNFGRQHFSADEIFGTLEISEVLSAESFLSVLCFNTLYYFDALMVY